MLTKTPKKIVKLLLAGTLGLATLFVPMKDTGNLLLPTVQAAEFCNNQGQLVNEKGEVVGTCSPENGTQSKKELADMLEIILKIIYIFLWPFLALAGLALDNGMVYGTYFQLDSALFTFRNIVKNFSNFALGFLFLQAILAYIFNFGNKATNPMGMISKLLIAGIGIQASRFVMGALIDVSTVATVGIGGLPLQLLKQEQVGDKPLFGIKTNLKISDIGNSMSNERGFVILYTYPTKANEYYLPCAVKNQKILWGDEWGAVFGVTATGKNIGNTDVKWPDQINQNYCIFGNDVVSRTESEGKTIQPGSDELKTILIDSQSQFRNENNCSTNSLCQTVANIANKGKGYQGVFYSLYGSLLNLSSIHVSVNKSEGSMAMEGIIKMIIGIAYLVPLMVLCVVLIIRIAVLWITIAFSPVLVLSEVFGFKKLGDLQKFGLKNALSMIFLPVIVTFAISISIVFLSVLSEGLTKGNSLDEIGMSTYAEGNKTCINLLVTTLCIDTPSQDIGVSGIIDFFPWLILNIFGIGLMWTIVMSSMKSTAFTKGVVDSLDKFAKNVVTTANIIPIGGGTSIAAVKNTGRQISNSIDAAAATNANTVVAPSVENFLQRTTTGKVGEGQKELKTASERIVSRDSAYNEVARLTGAGGALYNAPNSGISFRGNQLDLSQYGNEGLNVVNKIAATNKSLNNGKPYDDVESAFRDENFLKYLATPKTNGGVGLSENQMKSLYSGRDELRNDVTEKIDKAIAEANATASAQAVGTQKGATFTTADQSSVYTITPEGFSERKKGSTSDIFHNDEKSWEAILPTIDRDIMKKMKDDGKISPNTTFNAWLNKTTTSSASTTNNNSTTTTNTTSTNTSTTTNNNTNTASTNNTTNIPAQNNPTTPPSPPNTPTP